MTHIDVMKDKNVQGFLCRFFFVRIRSDDKCAFSGQHFQHSKQRESKILYIGWLENYNFMYVSILNESRILQKREGIVKTFFVNGIEIIKR